MKCTEMVEGEYCWISHILIQNWVCLLLIWVSICDTGIEKIIGNAWRLLVFIYLDGQITTLCCLTCSVHCFYPEYNHSRLSYIEFQSHAWIGITIFVKLKSIRWAHQRRSIQVRVSSKRKLVSCDSVALWKGWNCHWKRVKRVSYWSCLVWL
jgi:hypothetical protein